MPMKILEVCPYDMSRPGGVQTHIRDLSAWLTSQGHEVRIIAPRPKSPINLPDLIPLGYAHKIGFQGSQFEISLAGRGAIRSLKHEMARFGAQIVHLHTPWTPLLAWQVWRSLELPTVATFHATIPDADNRTLSSRFLYLTAGHFMRHIQATIVPSLAPLQALAPYANGCEIKVLPPSVDLTDWRQGANNGSKFGNEKISLLFLGRFEHRKGIETMLKAWHNVAQRMPNAHLTIAGSGVLQSVVEKTTTQSAGRITFVPQPCRQTAIRLMQNADIFIAPAEYGESFGIVLLEAMAAGAVPVAAANAGYKTVMTGPGADLLFPPSDAPALAEKIVALAQGPDLRARLRKWGSRHCQTYELSQTGPQFQAIFQRVSECRVAS